jgi:hypothetical protein
MKNNLTIKSLLKLQDNFSSTFYDKKTMSAKQKEEMLKTITLAMHHEVSEIVSSSNFKVFDKTDYEVDKDKILYNSIDVFRYLMAIMNLYEISSEEFISSFDERDIHLKVSKNIKSPETSQKVIVVDIDDVVCDFRNYFNNWLYKTYGVYVDQNNTSYYSSKEVKNKGLSPEGVFENFISCNEFLNIPPIDSMVKFLRLAKEENIYIQLLTSRPSSNLKCKYQTYAWLENNNIPFDNLDFAAEKYIWVAKRDFYLNGNLMCAIDDSPKHAMEYATHDIKVFVPKMPYNDQISHENIHHYVLEDLEKFKF